jgi:hypothetical protein
MPFIARATGAVEAAPEVYQDEAYVAELRRRAAILLPVLGDDRTPELDELVKAAKKAPR